MVLWKFIIKTGSTKKRSRKCLIFKELNMEIKNELEEIGGENGWELDADEEAALEAAWAKERTPEFLARMARQAALTRV